MNTRQLFEDFAGDAMTGVIYFLRDPRDGACRYVGQTTDPSSREMNHANSRVFQGNVALLNWKWSLSSNGLSPTFEIVQSGIPISELNTREREWIVKQATSGCQLLNRPVGAIKSTDLCTAHERESCRAMLNEARDMVQCVMTVSRVVASSKDGKTLWKIDTLLRDLSCRSQP